MLYHALAWLSDLRPALGVIDSPKDLSKTAVRKDRSYEKMPDSHVQIDQCPYCGSRNAQVVKKADHPLPKVQPESETAWAFYECLGNTCGSMVFLRFRGREIVGIYPPTGPSYPAM